MRVAMIDPSLFTLPYDQALAAGLAGNGHSVALYGRRAGAEDNRPRGVELVEAFYRITGSPPVAALPRKLRLAVKGFDHAWSMARLAGRLRREAPDVIHFQWLPLPMVDRRMLGALRRIAPLVLTVHDTNPFNGDAALRLQARGFFDCLSSFDRVIVHTQQGHARLIAQGVPAARLAVVPHGPLDGPSTPPAPDAMQGDITFMLFGKIKPYKGADTLLEAFARLDEPLRRQARLRIVGKPYMELEPLHALVRRHGLADRVNIEPRFVADDEIGALFAPGTVAVFPYREIDTSGVLMQALAHARPIIGSRIGCFAEMLGDGVHGHLVAPDDIDGFAAAMAHVITDRAFAAGCSRAALAVSQDGPGWREIAGLTADIYAAAVAAGAAGSNRATPISSSTGKTIGANC
jgi:glycosyltransferase involved in cell wall biosynthesis